MQIKNKRVLVCDCEKTMPLTAAGVARACGAVTESPLYTQLCRSEIDSFIDAARTEGEGLVVCCTQEQVAFEEALAEQGLEPNLRYVNIRERAGWSVEAQSALPKIAGLIHESTLDLAPVPSVAMVSNGTCLVYGGGQTAVDAARQLNSRLTVSLLLTDIEDVLPLGAADMMISRGEVAAARGHLGAFEVNVNRYAPVRPSSRHHLDTGLFSDGTAATCDIIIDLSGGRPLFASPNRRDGYLRADPNDPVAVQRALFEAVELLGEFEKPRYVTFRGELCTHSRNKITGCTRCLDVCPVSAITPDGDMVSVDPYICGGCGACNAVCPTGAITYSAPEPQSLLERLRVLLRAYDAAGGQDPVLLIYGAEDSEMVIEAMARFGRGLPAQVLPMAVNQVTQLGADFLLSALAFGVRRITLLVAPSKRDELAGLAGQVGLCESVMTGLGYDSGRLQVLVESDPDPVEAALYHPVAASGGVLDGFLPQPEKRTNLRLAAARLHQAAPQPVDEIALAPGSAFGAVLLDTDKCTLCLACVSACPTGALGDNPDRPQVSFQEEACVQCGLCRHTCPEEAIALRPRLSFDTAVKDHVVLYEEEPFNCVSCGKPFGSRGTIEKMAAQLADHPMFQGQAADRLKMCEDCRVIAHFDEKAAPMAAGARPKPRTTDDYLAARASGEDEET